MKKAALLLLLIAILFTGCSDNIQLDFDNPHSKERSVTLDGEVITLPPQSTVSLEVPRGEHSIKLANDSVISYSFDEDMYLINPTMTDYVIEKIYFSVSGNPVLQATFNKANRRTITFLGYEVQGNYEVFNDLIMARDWNYKQRQAVPEVISVQKKKFSSSRNIRKLYAADEFLLHLKEKKEQQ